MKAADITHILVDTTGLYDLGKTDFQVLVQYSKDGRFKLVAPYIAWEERRTKLLEAEYAQVLQMKSAHAKLESRRPDSMLAGLTLPAIATWTFEQVNEESKRFMDAFARSNNFDLIALDQDHAPRAWERYFEIRLPFTRDQPDREQRRKDIPDSWIFESAIDFAAAHPGLVAMTADKKLSKCFQSIGLRVFENAAELRAFLEPEEEIAAAAPVPPAMMGILPAAAAARPLDELLDNAQQASRLAEQTILGLIGSLDQITDDDAETLMALAGITLPVWQNAAERLVLAGLIQKTGGRLIPRNKGACDLAISLVEPLVVKFVDLPQA